MPDGMNMSPAAEGRPQLGAEDRAHRLHALVFAIATLELDGSLQGDEAENARGNLLRLAQEESTALIATGGFC